MSFLSLFSVKQFHICRKHYFLFSVALLCFFKEKDSVSCYVVSLIYCNKSFLHYHFRIFHWVYCQLFLNISCAIIVILFDKSCFDTIALYQSALSKTDIHILQNEKLISHINPLISPLIRSYFSLLKFVLGKKCCLGTTFSKSLHSGGEWMFKTTFNFYVRKNSVCVSKSEVTEERLKGGAHQCVMFLWLENKSLIISCKVFDLETCYSAHKLKNYFCGNISATYYKVSLIIT